jgi:hypothetical protein
MNTPAYARFMAAAFALLSLPLAAQDPPAAAEAPALVVSGKLRGGAPVAFTMAQLAALPAAGFTGLDPWDGKRHAFAGVLLADVLALAGIDAAAVRINVIAKNKYEIPVRRADYEKAGYLLAWSIDGRPFGDNKATSNRGPLAIAIDFGAHPELDPEIYKHQLVWQTVEIVAE